MKFSEDVVPLTADEECAFMRAVAKGLSDLDAGRETSLSTVKSQLGLGLACHRVREASR